jgi:hypothetical protein
VGHPLEAGKPGNVPRREIRLVKSVRVLACALLLVGPAPAALADEASPADGAPPSGDEIARRINARDDGDQVRRRLVMELVDDGGNVRVRETLSFRKQFGDERRSVLFFESPGNVKDTAFLTYDHPEAGRDDDQWLYLPALRKVRRIAGADRGGWFLGTDMSYEDMKNETRVSIHDYERRTLGRGEVDGRPCWRVEHVPVDEEVARELGYGRVVTCVDPEIWLIRRSEFWDERGRKLKTTRVGDVRRVDGIWTPHRIETENHQSGHRTIFTFHDVDYASPVPDDLFTERALRRGP